MSNIYLSIRHLWPSWVPLSCSVRLIECQIHWPHTESAAGYGAGVEERIIFDAETLTCKPQEMMLRRLWSRV